jgi:hypothetical protein
MNPPPGCRFHTRCPHVQPICRDQPPPLRELAPGRASACHFAEDLPVHDVAIGEGIAPLAAQRLALYAAAKGLRAAG